jgi:acyl-coenzyme A thioesterase PaaI-like protein
MKDFTALDPDFAKRTHASFERQAFMKTIGATLEQVEPGFVEIHLPINPAITQQHGFVHAGAVASIADSACGYAAFTLMPADAGVLAWSSRST